MTAAASKPAYGDLTNQGASTNIAWHHTSVDRAARAEQRGHRSAILWFTGLSGSGKSTLANAVNQALFERGLSCYVLDGDNIRHGLCKDLGFSDAAREENIRRIGEVSKLFLDAGWWCSRPLCRPSRPTATRPAPWWTPATSSKSTALPT